MEQAEAAGSLGMESGALAADRLWTMEARRMIRSFMAGYAFLAEDVVNQLDNQGFTTSNSKAIGPIMRSLAGERVIEKTGRTRKSRTSHGLEKLKWRRR